MEGKSKYDNQRVLEGFMEKMSEELKQLQKAWPETLEILKEAKESASNDIFSKIEYLAFCDQFFKATYTNLKKISFFLSKANNPELQELRANMDAKMQNISDDYAILAEETLRKAQDNITKIAFEMPQDKLIPDPKADVTQNLEKDLFLQELRDSLEFYRQERSEYVVELQKDAASPKEDSILSQLDTTIAECDTALLIKDIND